MSPPELTTTSAPVTRSTQLARTPPRRPSDSVERARAAAAGVEQPACARARARRRGRSRSAAAVCSVMTPRRTPLSPRELVEPRLDRRRAARPGSPAASCWSLRDRARGLRRRVLLLAEQAGRGALRLGRAARRSCPARSREASTKPHGRDRDHRQDDHDDEEDGESVAKAHVGHRATGQPSRATATIGPTVDADRLGTAVRSRGYSSVGRAPGSHPGGRGFESP